MSALLLASYVWSQVVISGKAPVQQFGINDRGETAVTNSDGTSGIYRNGKFRLLPEPPASCACTTKAIAINDGGSIVGIAAPPSGSPEQGFVLSRGSYTLFSWAGWENTEPRSIGPQGLIVGWAFSTDGSRSADFVFDPATGAFTDITPPNAGYPSIVQGINRFARVAGNTIQRLPHRTFFGSITQYQAGNSPRVRKSCGVARGWRRRRDRSPLERALSCSDNSAPRRSPGKQQQGG